MILEKYKSIPEGKIPKYIEFHDEGKEVAEDIFISALDTKGERWCYWKNTKVSLKEKNKNTSYFTMGREEGMGSGEEGGRRRWGGERRRSGGGEGVGINL